MKRILKSNRSRAFIFLCIIAALVLVFDSCLGFADASRSNTVFDEFYAQEENSVDCIYFGSSVTQRAYVVPVAYKEHGVRAYSIACGTQPFVLTKYLMEEAQKTQDPKLFIVELKGVCKSPDDLWDAAYRRVIDNMKYSLTRVDAIKAMERFAANAKEDTGVDETGLSYYFPIIKYHTRWNPSKQPNYFNNIYYFNGYSLDGGLSFKIRERHTLEYDEHTDPIDPVMEESLNELLDYCDTLENAKVLFVIAPYESSELGMGKLNYAKNIVEGRGYECLNFLPIEKREELGLKDNTSYYNKEHLNYYGSLKYTEYLTSYIMENYGITDRRGQDGSGSWEEAYDRLMDTIDTEYSKDYKKLMKKVRKAEAGDR